MGDRIFRPEEYSKPLAIYNRKKALGDMVAMGLMAPELRGLWGMGSVNESGNVLDLSGQGRTLTNNGSAPRAVHGNLVPYVSLDGSTQYLSRADEAGLDITGALTVLAWGLPRSAGGVLALASKWTAAGNQRGWHLQRQANSAILAAVSTNGTASVTAATVGTLSTQAWGFMGLRFTPSTELAVWLNEEKVVNTTSIPATIYNSSAALMVGGISAAASWYGYAGVCLVCAGALSDDWVNAWFEAGRGFFGI